MTVLLNSVTPAHWHDAEGRHLLPDYRRYRRLPRLGRRDIALYVAHLRAHELAVMQGRHADDPPEVVALFDEIEGLEEARTALYGRVAALRLRVPD